jgi:hypothetical protein
MKSLFKVPYALYGFILNLELSFSSDWKNSSSYSILSHYGYGHTAYLEILGGDCPHVFQLGVQIALYAKPVYSNSETLYVS